MDYMQLSGNSLIDLLQWHYRCDYKMARWTKKHKLLCQNVHIQRTVGHSKLFPCEMFLYIHSSATMIDENVLGSLVWERPSEIISKLLLIKSILVSHHIWHSVTIAFKRFFLALKWTLIKVQRMNNWPWKEWVNVFLTHP